MAMIYRVDGTQEEISNPSLTQLQAAVGGHIEALQVGPGRWMVVDEEGLYKGYRPNPQASLFVGSEHLIVGDFLIATTEELNGDNI